MKELRAQGKSLPGDQPAEWEPLAPGESAWGPDRRGLTLPV